MIAAHDLGFRIGEFVPLLEVLLQTIYSWYALLIIHGTEAKQEIPY